MQNLENMNLEYKEDSLHESIIQDQSGTSKNNRVRHGSAAIHPPACAVGMRGRKRSDPPAAKYTR